MIYFRYKKKKYITMASDKNNLLLMFDRPTEPLFMGKGDNQVTFDIPEEYYVSLCVFLHNK